MKKMYIIALLSLATVAIPAATKAADITNESIKERVAHMTTEEKKARAEEIKHRVYEIKTMDKSSLTREERKALRSELKSMKKEARAIEGFYISVGAAIIIILLLILII